MDFEYRRVIEDCRSRWNGAYPEYRLAPDRRIVEGAMPESLHAALEAQRELEAREGMAHLFDRYKEPPAVFNAWHSWHTLVSGIVMRFWPPVDLPNPYLLTEYPAWSFVVHCLLQDPRIFSGDCDRFFHGFELEPMPMLSELPENVPYSVEHTEAAEYFAAFPEDLLSEVTWVVPLYPGITADDIRKAAPEIARTAEEIYRSRTPRARVHALRTHDGLTYQQIADRLGLHVNTVASILSGANETTGK